MHDSFILRARGLISMDDETSPDADSVAVSDGRIAAVGSFHELKSQFPSYRVEDADGYLLPAFIDPHSHYTNLAMAQLQIPLDGLSSEAQIEAAVNEYLSQNKPAPGEWLTARGYDNNNFPNARHLTLDFIDRLTDNPLIICHKSGHVGYLNSAAMRRLGIDSSTESPEGGLIEKRNGQPTGYFEENAFIEYQKKIPLPGVERLSAAFERAQSIYAENGIATIQDGMIVREMSGIYQMLMTGDRQKLDLVAYAGPDDYLELKRELFGGSDGYVNQIRHGCSDGDANQNRHDCSDGYVNQIRQGGSNGDTNQMRYDCSDGDANQIRQGGSDGDTNQIRQGDSDGDTNQIRHDCADGYTNHIRLGGVKIFLDGSPQGRTAWMREPYLPDSSGVNDYRGYGTMTDDEVVSAMRFAAVQKTQLLAHCNGDAAVEQFLRCYEVVLREYPVIRGLRFVIIHGQLMGRDQLARAAELGVMVSFFVAHILHWGDVHIKNFGLERASRISPAGSAVRAGLRFTFHQDSPVIMPDMLETISAAVLRMTRGGVLLGGDERISTERALRAVTLDAAYQYGEEHYKGSLSPGKRADMVLLDADITKTRPEDIAHLHVVGTWKDGVRIYG